MRLLTSRRLGLLLVAVTSASLTACQLVADLSGLDGYGDTPPDAADEGDQQIAEGTEAGTDGGWEAGTEGGTADRSVPPPMEDARADVASAPDDAAPAEVGAEVVTTGSNLINNPSCDQGTLDWATLSGSPIESSTTFVHAGDMHSCHAYDRTNVEMTGSLASYDGPLQDITSAVSAGHTYYFAVWALWSRPGALPDAGADASPEAGPEAGPEASPEAAPVASHDGGDASSVRRDAAAADAAADASAETGATLGPQNVYVTVKEGCGTNMTYVRVGEVDNVPEERWTQVVANVSIPASCASGNLQLYVEGPDVGLDLYTDEATLLFSH
jgi:hypothetical protein